MTRQERQITEVLRKLYLKIFLRGGRPGGAGKKPKTPASVGRKLSGALVLYALIGLGSVQYAFRGVFPLSFQLHNITMIFTVLFVSGMSGSILYRHVAGRRDQPRRPRRRHLRQLALSPRPSPLHRHVGSLPLTALNIIQFSKDSDACDFLRLTPMRGPGPLVHGARLAVMTVLVAPSILLIAAISYVLVKSFPHFLLLLLPGILTTPVYAHLAGALGKSIPLSLPVEDSRSATRGLWIVAAMIPSFIVSGLGLLAWKTGVFGYFLAGEALLAGVFCLVMKRSIDRLKWPRQEASEIVIGTPEDW